MKKYNISEQSKVLVEHILSQDYLKANDLLTKLINEAEEEREKQVADEFGFDDSQDNGEEIPNDGSDEVQLDGTNEDISDSEANEIVDDTIEIACQINTKIISKLFDKISMLKQLLNNAKLDEDSREFIKFDTSISYYSDKLQDLQGKTNPGIDQSKVEEALTKIDSAIEQLTGELDNNSSEDLTDVASPEEVSNMTNNKDSKEDENSKEDEYSKEDENSKEDKTSKEDEDAKENKDSKEDENSEDDFDSLFS